MYARALHRHSPRAGAPFVALNCAAIPDELIEAELFGVEKGAYTGAQQSRQGRFERADGGTLFLDEVGELSPAAQAKLLRVLQEGEFERVGDQTIRHADVRLVAATNLDLAQAVAEGRFRADLYYRLNIYPVRIAPLRERREDIPLLVEHFLAETCARYEKRMPGITERAMKALVGYDWPGNVRELRNTIERSVILLEPHERIDLKHIDPGTAANAPPPAREYPAMVERDVPGAAGTDLDALVEALLDSTAKLDELEPRLIELAVRRAKGNLSQAARDLGMTRPQLAYRMNKHGIVFDGGAERGGRRH
jgi:transcriptional regulator with GAF, ATPase, and Fis domain